MNTASPSPSSRPLGFLQSLLSGLKPPEWMVDELQNRVVLFLNHVLLQEPQALLQPELPLLQEPP